MDKRTVNNRGMGAILQGVSLLVDDKVKHSQFDKTLSGLVTYADYETNTYSVKINEYVYKNIPSSIKVNVNDSVLLVCPQNQISQMFISNKIDTTDYTMIDEPPTYSSNTTIKATNEEKGILTNTAALSLQLEAGSIYMLYGVSYTMSTGALGNNSVHVIYTSLLNSDTLATPTKISGTTNLPYTITQAANQTLTLTNLGASYNVHFALKKIY